MASQFASTSSHRAHSDSDDDSDDGHAAFTEARTTHGNSSDSDSEDSHNEQDGAEDWHDPSELAVSLLDLHHTLSY